MLVAHHRVVAAMRAPARALFATAALFNFATAAALFFFSRELFIAMELSALYRAELVPWLRQLAGLILVFGIGYGMMAWRPVEYRSLAVLGCIGKLAVVVVSIANAMVLPALLPGLWVAAVDGVFGVLFALYLLSSKPGRSSPTGLN